MRRRVRRLWVRLLLARGIPLRAEAGARVSVLRCAKRVAGHRRRGHALRRRRLAGAAAA